MGCQSKQCEKEFLLLIERLSCFKINNQSCISPASLIMPGSHCCSTTCDCEMSLFIYCGHRRMKHCLKRTLVSAEIYGTGF